MCVQILIRIIINCKRNFQTNPINIEISNSLIENVLVVINDDCDCMIFCVVVVASWIISLFDNHHIIYICVSIIMKI